MAVFDAFNSWILLRTLVRKSIIMFYCFLENNNVLFYVRNHVWYTIELRLDALIILFNKKNSLLICQIISLGHYLPFSLIIS